MYKRKIDNYLINWKNCRMKKYIFVTLCFVTSCVSAQKNVLFIGNSYIYTNDLPAMIADMASSTNDKIIYSSNTPGGCAFRQHGAGP